MESRKNQKEGQAYQREVKELGGTPSCFEVPWSSWPSFWIVLGSLAIHQAILILKGALKVLKITKDSLFQDLAPQVVF